MTRLFRRRDEQGVALITAIMVSFIATLFVITTMYVAFHDQTSSAHNRSWGQSLHVAESGVHEAIAYLQNSAGVVPTATDTNCPTPRTAGTVCGTTTDGTYQYRIVAQPRNRYQIDAIGTVGNTGSLQASRRLRVTMAPPISFKYALFSLADVTLKNNTVICGDVYAVSDVNLGNNDEIHHAGTSGCPTGVGDGNVTSSIGGVSSGNNTVIDGTVWSGGNAGISNGGSIGGDAKASSSTPGCTDDPSHLKYKITGGSVAGNASAWGTISSSVSGTKSQSTCTQSSAALTMPVFTFNASNYPAATLHTYDFDLAADRAAFSSYISANSGSLSGTFYITGGGSNYPVTLNGITVSGDLTVVATESPIEGGNGINASGGTDKLIVLASMYAPPPGQCATNGGNPGDCAIGFKNNFAPDSSNTAVLLYAPNGPIAIKNNLDFGGAVYANNIQFKNNPTVDYDVRLDQVVGFGSATLQVENWRECDPGTVTTSSCG